MDLAGRTLLSGMSPFLLVVSGLPAAGKTTLAAALADTLSWPLVTKDDYKAIVLRGLPDGTLPERSRRAGQLGFELMWQVAHVVLRAGASAVLETHFDRVQAPPFILGLTEEHGAAVRQIYCEAPRPELERRHALRMAAGSRPGIDLPDVHAQLPPTANWEPLDLGDAPCLRLDTTRPATVEHALAWIAQVC